MVVAVQALVMRNHSMPCFPGSAAGAWRPGGGPHWDLSGDCAPLTRYVWIEPGQCNKRVPSTVPNAGPSNMPSCMSHDAGRLASDLTNVSVLMVGDSTSAQILWHACEGFQSKPHSFVPINTSLHGPLKRYNHRLRSLDNHACRLRRGLTLGSFSHYGVAGPPYWVFAYPLAPWLSDTSVGMVRNDMPRFRALTARGHDPTLIVASSGFWDIASWWAHEGNFTKRWSVTLNDEHDAAAFRAASNTSSTHESRYLHGVHRFVRELRRTFPRSQVVWRLMHPGAKHSITPRIVNRFNAAVRAAAQTWRLPLLDVEAMVLSLNSIHAPTRTRGSDRCLMSQPSCARSNASILPLHTALPV